MEDIVVRVGKQIRLRGKESGCRGRSSRLQLAKIAAVLGVPLATLFTEETGEAD